MLSANKDPVNVTIVSPDLNSQAPKYYVQEYIFVSGIIGVATKKTD